MDSKDPKPERIQALTELAWRRIMSYGVGEPQDILELSTPKEHYEKLCRDVVVLDEEDYLKLVDMGTKELQRRNEHHERHARFHTP